MNPWTGLRVRGSTGPVGQYEEGNALVVTAAEGSDFWRTTHYGFVRDSAHALQFALAPGQALEVDFDVDYAELYD